MAEMESTIPEFEIKQAFADLLNSGDFERRGFASFTPDILAQLVPEKFLELPENSGAETQIVIIDQSMESIRFLFGAHEYLELEMNIVCSEEGRYASVYIVNYEHSDNIPGHAITTEFYFRLEDMLRRLGFVYYHGKASEGNVDYFVEKLGRNRTRELLDTAEVVRICGYTAERAIQFMTHKKLN